MSPIHQCRSSFYSKSRILRVDVFLLFLVICVAPPFMVRSAWAQEEGYQPIIDNRFIMIEAGKKVPVEWIKEATRIHVDAIPVFIKDNDTLTERWIWISDDDIAPIRHAKELEELWILGSQVSGPEIEIILKLPHLKRIDYKGVSHVDDVMKVIGRVKGLEHLSVAGSKMTNQAIFAIGKLEHLKYLDLEETGIDSRFFEQGIDLPSTLTHLRLDEVQLDNSVIEKLPKGLTHLSLNGTGLKPDVIPMLKRFEQLKRLEIFANDWSGKDYERLETQLPNVAVNSTGFSTF
ncbi:hypothetical protein AB1L30_27400 [Bremerella sp. JC817]|uniref:hypothetical protein n=1 Tax=Bremerella sp. JC817 TaxID=3231756 RepID=UPI00345A2CDC